MSELKQKIQDDMKAAMRAGEKPRLGVIRMILAAIKQREIDEKITLDDTAVLAVVDKMVKQRRESVEQYKSANRQDLVEQESFEIEVLQAYLPQQLNAEEIDELVTNAIADSGAESPRDMGKVMGILKPQMQGRANMGEVSKLVKQKLG